jgi:hypothetical protein
MPDHDELEESLSEQNATGNLNYVHVLDIYKMRWEYLWTVKRQDDGKFWGLAYNASVGEVRVVHTFELRDDAKNWASKEAWATGGSKKPPSPVQLKKGPGGDTSLDES